MKVCIWLPPAADHEAWQRLTGETWTRAEFEQAVATAVETAIAENHEPEIVALPVRAMRERLGDRENTPANRAAVIVGDEGGPYRRGRTLSLLLTRNPDTRKQAVGWALIEENQRPAKKSEQVIGPGGVAEAIRVLLKGL